MPNLPPKPSQAPTATVGSQTSEDYQEGQHPGAKSKYSGNQPSKGQKKVVSLMTVTAQNTGKGKEIVDRKGLAESAKNQDISSSCDFSIHAPAYNPVSRVSSSSPCDSKPYLGTSSAFESNQTVQLEAVTSPGVCAVDLDFWADTTSDAIWAMDTLNLQTRTDCAANGGFLDKNICDLPSSLTLSLAGTCTSPLTSSNLPLPMTHVTVDETPSSAPPTSVPFNQIPPIHPSTNELPTFIRRVGLAHVLLGPGACVQHVTCFSQTSIFIRRTPFPAQLSSRPTLAPASPLFILFPSVVGTHCDRL
ncbi:hypothetical protein FRC12_000653 [Ceratobasidium sp. 428]|nr:hypothetical protein FRC12_000653 [Ceratobasidium sp. 428]